MNTNTAKIPSFYTTTSGVPTPPHYSAQQPIHVSDQKYDYQQQPQQAFGGQQFGEMVRPPATSQQQQPQQAFGGQQFGMVTPPATSQQPQFQHAYPGNPTTSQNSPPQILVVQQQASTPMQYPQQPMYGQQFPTSILIGGLSSEPGLVDCPRCGRRGLTNTSTVAGATTHMWALLCCFFLCLGCIPYLMRSLQDVEHRCSSCGALIATWRR